MAGGKGRGAQERGVSSSSYSNKSSSSSYGNKSSSSSYNNKSSSSSSSPSSSSSNRRRYLSPAVHPTTGKARPGESKGTLLRDLSPGCRALPLG